MDDIPLGEWSFGGIGFAIALFAGLRAVASRLSKGPAPTGKSAPRLWLDCPAEHAWKAEIAEGGVLLMRARLLAEFLGAFAVVFAGTGAIIINEVSGGVVTHMGVALTFGLIVMAMIYTLGEVSGAHMNPAVTIGFIVSRRFPAGHGALYVLAQVSGAVGASGLLRLLFPGNALLGATLPSGPALQSFILEIILAFFLMLVILNVSTGAQEKGMTAGIVVGAVIALEAMFAGPVSGASMNPARSLGPALLAGHFQHLWIYLTAPVMGAILAAPTCAALRGSDCCGWKRAQEIAS